MTWAVVNSWLHCDDLIIQHIDLGALTVWFLLLMISCLQGVRHCWMVSSAGDRPLLNCTLEEGFFLSVVNLLIVRIANDCIILFSSIGIDKICSKISQYLIDITGFSQKLNLYCAITNVVKTLAKRCVKSGQS